MGLFSPDCILRLLDALVWSLQVAIAARLSHLLEAWSFTTVSVSVVV